VKSRAVDAAVQSHGREGGVLAAAGRGVVLHEQTCRVSSNEREERIIARKLFMQQNRLGSAEAINRWVRPRRALLPEQFFTLFLPKILQFAPANSLTAPADWRRSAVRGRCTCVVPQ
jgi:hypothetical protein